MASQISLIEVVLTVVSIAVISAAIIGPIGTQAAFQKAQAECIAFRAGCDRADDLATKIGIEWRSRK